MTKRWILAVAVVLAALLAVSGGAWLLRQAAREGQGADKPGAPGAVKAAKFHCPMHPAMVSDHPGDCPICQMRMVPMVPMDEGEPDEPTTSPPASAPAPAPIPRKTVYRSTMNPNEVSDRPGKDSMGMEMVPVEVEGEASSPPAAVTGLAAVHVTTRKQQLIGVKTSVVTRSSFRRNIRAVGRVTYDETREKHVTTKTAGYVEKLYANALGELFHEGQPLLEIYSPELLASQQEFLLALKARSRTAASSLPAIAASGEELVASARRRLELFDLTGAQILELESSGQATRTLTLYAPVTGYLTHRAVTQGDKVESGAHLMDLTDLSRVWVLASVYEYELPFVQKGQEATMALSYLPGQAFKGRVSLVYPVLEPSTRTAQVRLEFPNPGLILKPEMYAEVGLEANLGDRLAVPDTAVMETGVRSVVFVDRGDGFFEPREVSIGLRLPNAYEVLDGLAEGEKVLTSGNFFIDSESKLKAALAAMAEDKAASGHPH